MYIATVPNRKSPPAILLRESYRENSKVKTRTIANLTHWKPERIEALRRALKGEFDNMSGDPVSGEIFGVVFALKQLADQVGISQALGRTDHGRLVMFLVIARIAHAGSRLSSVRWAQQHAISDILGVDEFDEDDLYTALDWLAAQQEVIEQRLYRAYVKKAGQPPVIVLYDVTSSYLEGEQNELGMFGYNRDGKRGKKQIIVGLLTAQDGEPLAVRVFEGNTADPATVTTQIDLLKAQFGIKEVVLVGDRGMIKSKGKAALSAQGWKYITALTNSQIRKLLDKKVIQMGLFDTDLQEVEHDGKRLILYRSETVRHREQQRREDKLQRLAQKIEQRNAFVTQSSRAQPESGLEQLQQWLKRHKLNAFVVLELDQRMIQYRIDKAALTEHTLLEGCYTLESTVDAKHMDTEAVAERYRDLQKVERNFRTLKTGFLEVRPIFLRKADRTRAHVFVAMLALKITRVFEDKLSAVKNINNKAENPTIDDALTALTRITYLYYHGKDQVTARLPKLDTFQQLIIEALGISFPKQAAAVRRQ